jgi:hypothetical protein
MKLVSVVTCGQLAQCVSPGSGLADARTWLRSQCGLGTKQLANRKQLCGRAVVAHRADPLCSDLPRPGEHRTAARRLLHKITWHQTSVNH